MTVVRSGDESLEALYHRGRAAQPIVTAGGHPCLYGTMDSTVLAELTWALTRRGHPTLRFNWRGVGASTGSHTLPDLFDWPDENAPLPREALDDAFADLSAAIDQQLATHGVRTVAVVGYSFGAAVAARAAVEHEAVDRVVLIAPPVTRLPFDFRALEATGVTAAIACGELDRFAPADAVEAMVEGTVGVHRIVGAGHEFIRGLGPLGSFVTSSFPQVDEPLF